MANCEDLATKAELQELRDQLNAVIGETEDGGTTEVFRAGTSSTNSLAQLAATVYAGTKFRAAQAITDIRLSSPSTGNVVYGNFANGSTTLKVIKGGREVGLSSLNTVTKAAGTGAAGAGLTAQAGFTAKLAASCTFKFSTASS